MVRDPNSSSLLESLFAGDGEMCALMRSHDWSQTPLGPVEQWPQGLRSAISILLPSKAQICLFWGPEFITFYNDAYRPVFASKHPHALGIPASESWSEIWEDALGPLFRNVVATGESFWAQNYQFFLLRNGYIEETYFDISYDPVRDESGRVGGVFCIVTETTVRVLGERRLRTLRELATNTADAKTVEEACSLAIKTLANNPHDIPFALLYRVEAEGRQARLVEATGISVGTPSSPQQIDLTQESDPWLLAQVKRTGEAAIVNDLTFNLLPADSGSGATPTAFVIPIASSAQKPLDVFLVVGISPRRVFDEDYRGFFDLVASNIATSITNADAYEAERKRAEALAEIDRAKTIFFSNVSHEFRTPLTLMLAPIEDALADTEDPLSPTQRDRIEILQRNGLRLLKLVNTLLDFSRIEAGRIQAVYEPTDLAIFTAELASTFRSLIERAGMSLVVECPPLPEAVYVDREMWEKIVLNLLSNAFKFTFTGTITVRLHSCNNCVELAVKDTGIGIPPDEIPRLFERFHRVKGAEGRSFEGSGIGLSLVQELVKLHGGSVCVTSELGTGSCFTVSIPTGFAHLPSERLRRGEAERIGASRTLASTAMGATPYVEEAWRWVSEVRDREDPSLSPPSFPSLPSPPSPCAKILIVDDNADMRDYAKRLLKQRYEVEAVEDGIAALIAIGQRIPDLVLTDVMMPRLDGFGLLRELRADPKTREIPIILLSARAGEESRIEGLETGADDYLTKPFSSRELLARVEASLKMAQIRREAAVREQALRLAAETAQQESEAIAQRLSHILESMTGAFMALDKDWRIIYQNAEAERINNGTLRSEVLGKTHWEVWPASAGSILEEQYRYAMAEQVPVHFEYHYYSPPDYNLWVEIRAYPSTEGLGIFYHDITARKQAEAALRESQAQLQRQLAEIEAIYQSAAIGLNVLDTDLRFVRINQRLAEMNGLPVEAHIGRTIRELLPDLADAVESLLHPILETGEPLLNVEITGETPAQPGVQRTWLESFLPLKEGDRIIGINTVCEEITERKQMEAQRKQAEAELRQAKEELEIRVAERTAELRQINADLQHSESTLRSFFDSAAMPMGIVELYENDVFHISDNWAAAQFFGTTPEAMQNQFSSALGATQETIQRWCGYYRQAEQTQKPVWFEYLHTTTQGQRWLSGSVCPIAVSPNGYPRFSYIVEDISDRKYAEATLARKEEQLRLTLEFTHIGTWDWEIQTGEVIWSDNHFRLLGLEPEPSDGLYQRWRNAIHPEDVERVEQALLTALTQHSDYEAEYRVVHPDGAVHWLVGKGRGVYNKAHEPIRMLGVILDVSDRKQAEEHIAASLREKEVLLQEIHHRVKNNLAIITSLLRMQSRKTQDLQAKAILRDSQNRIASIALVHEKLYRSENLANIDFSQYIRDLTIYLFESYNIRSNQIKLSIQVDKVSLDIDTAIPCGLIINELVSNALKYAFSSSLKGEIQVSFCQLSEHFLEKLHQRTFTLIVQDNGIGLPNDFEVQKYKTLGLNLVQGLVKQIDGTIEINSQQGTEFKITFTKSDKYSH